MDIIIVSHKRGRTWRFPFNPKNVVVWLPVLVVFSLLVSVSFAAGMAFSGSATVNAHLPAHLLTAWTDDVRQQREALTAARAQAEQNTAALARRIAQLQAHVLRLDAAGQRLTQMAGLDSGEFNFDQAPALGGPETASDADLGLDSVMESLIVFERQLSDRERQFRVLEDLLLASRLQKEVRPSGWPIDGGWISSLFGSRTDPFTGRRTSHQGIDFAGREGSAVLTVAAGIVTEAGPRDGYGNLVEINHGNGYTTRYGHNNEIVVKPGDKVAKGQRIAKMGSTGRSTGPHVHFEVLFNGQVVNPEQYIRAAR